MIDCTVIIPALNPNESLIEYVKTLLSEGVGHIIVVNDGSLEDLKYIFTELSMIESCTVLAHKENSGKGRALKTGFKHYLNQKNAITGVITADADGQHSVEDVCKVAKALVNSNEGIFFGVRDFNESNIPVRSYFGNRITSFIFQLLFRYRLKDTQTGLRGIPHSELKWISELKGERYEYEMNMLINAAKRKIKINEIPIQTLYFNNNASSHYNPIIDSIIIFHKLITEFFHSTYTRRLHFQKLMSGKNHDK
ncbi:glycosyltransferase family 2 protein [Lederbergia citrea]|uniref:glycosyltransferase family 2 protein n=1 Tax=Lederbergia citrea TaxID=2833581 RepID=UPI001BC8E721|nr:glycosyltransferase family 2 protein [Lederbergia citrea]MBS4179530.1 glycosyltransferase family 2 protein [Lederbergia citrea]